jgi:hypothetical protein
MSSWLTRLWHFRVQDFFNVDASDPSELQLLSALEARCWQLAAAVPSPRCWQERFLTALTASCLVFFLQWCTAPAFSMVSVNGRGCRVPMGFRMCLS